MVVQAYVVLAIIVGVLYLLYYHTRCLCILITKRNELRGPEVPKKVGSIPKLLALICLKIPQHRAFFAVYIFWKILFSSSKVRLGLGFYLNLIVLWLWQRITGVSLLTLQVSLLIIDKCFLRPQQITFKIGYQDLLVELFVYLEQTQNFRIYVSKNLLCFNPEINKWLAHLLSKIPQTETGRDLLHIKKRLEDRSFLIQTKQKNIWHLGIKTTVGDINDETQMAIWSNTTSRDRVFLSDGGQLDLNLCVTGEPKNSFLIPPYENQHEGLHTRGVAGLWDKLVEQDSRRLLLLGGYKRVHTANILTDLDTFKLVQTASGLCLEPCPTEENLYIALLKQIENSRTLTDSEKQVMLALEWIKQQKPRVDFLAFRYLLALLANKYPYTDELQHRLRWRQALTDRDVDLIDEKTADAMLTIFK